MMSLWNLLATTVLLFCSLQAEATMTLISISGDSAQDLSTATKPVIYGGFTTGCVGDGTSTCDSCTGADNSGSKLWTCNKRNAYPSLPVIVRLQSTNTGASAANAFVKINDNKISLNTAQTFADGILNTQITWGEICNAFGKSTDCSGGSFAGDMTIGLDVSSGGSTTSDSMTFKIAGRVAATDGSDWFYTDCNTADATGNIGFCHFEVFPGDGKIYADNLVVAPGYPASPSSGIEYTNVAFFYEEQLSGEDDNTTLARLSNASGYFSVGVNKAASPPVADNRITGLSNNVRYCMVMANQDATGIISYFTPLPGVSGSPVTAAELCTTPTEVIGLLDDKHCFIATAAFGSDMAPEVQSFREFRNKFLLSNSLGKAFVKFYYKHSPYYAHLIAESEVAKTGVRVALWPLLLFARMSVAFGFWLTLLILSLGTLSTFEIYRRLVMGKNFRGEL